MRIIQFDTETPPNPTTAWQALLIFTTFTYGQIYSPYGLHVENAHSRCISLPLTVYRLERLSAERKEAFDGYRYSFCCRPVPRCTQPAVRDDRTGGGKHDPRDVRVCEHA